jgi:hypothetical protein
MSDMSDGEHDNKMDDGPLIFMDATLRGGGREEMDKREMDEQRLSPEKPLCASHPIDEVRKYL